MPCEKYKRFWAVTDTTGRLICLAVYRKGAEEVLRRLGLDAEAAQAGRPLRRTRMTKGKRRTRLDRQRIRQKGKRT